MGKGKVLVVGSNATRIEIQGGGAGPTGQYLNETVVPVMALVEAGYEIVLATPEGTKPHIDPVSDVAQHFGGDEAAYKRGRAFFDDDPAMNNVRTLKSVIKMGSMAMQAFSSPAAKRRSSISCRTPISARSCATSMRAGNPPRSYATGRSPRSPRCRRRRNIGLPLAKGWQYAGYKMTVFSASEEKPIEEQILHGKLYFSMPDALRMAGGDVITNPVDFSPHVAEDRELITGQNPRSDHPLAAKLVEVLNRAAVSA